MDVKEYREPYKDVADQLFSKWFFQLWDYSLFFVDTGAIHEDNGYHTLAVPPSIKTLHAGKAVERARSNDMHKGIAGVG